MANHGLPCWYELGASDAAGARSYYTRVLGWDWRDAGMPDMDYHIASANGVMVAGMMPVMSPDQPVAWTIYFAVDGCDATVTKAQGLGGQVIVPPTDIPETGRFALLLDPQGAAFGILEPLPGDASGAFDQTKSGHGNWHELNTPDADTALAFYNALFGWTVSAVHEMPGMAYRVLACGGRDIGGIAPMGPEIPASWTPYFGCATTITEGIAALTAAGGTTMHPPMPVPGGAVIVNATDAQGARFALVGPA